MKSIQRHGLHEQVIAEIGQRIVGGEFRPGEALPGEVELCSALSVSRTALREALRVLSAKGLVTAKPKIGTLVSSTEDWHFLDDDVLRWYLQSHNSARAIAELYELRHLVEPLAASLAARNADAAALEALRQAYAAMEAAGDDGESIMVPDLAFHRTIIAASGNRLFSSLARVMAAALSVNFELVRNAPRGHAHSMPAHKDVLDAILEHDSTAARMAMQKLIEDSQSDALAVRAATSSPGVKVADRKKKVRGR